MAFDIPWQKLELHARHCYRLTTWISCLALKMPLFSGGNVAFFYKLDACSNTL